MANTHHTGIPKLQWSFTYPPCVPSITIVADKNPFCLGDSVTFTPTFNCVEDITITAYGWVVNGTIQSTSSEPFVSNTLTNNDTVYLLIVTNNGQTYISNVITMQEKTEGCITEIKYGLLYNWYAATDARNICAEGWEVPDSGIWYGLMLYLDPAGYYSTNISGGKLKETGTEHWETPNSGAINSVNFNAKGSGLRVFGNFMLLHQNTVFWNKDEMNASNARVSNLFYDSESLNTSNVSISVNIIAPKNTGNSIRLSRPATEAELLLADGTACAPYIGNDGKVYPTVKIGTQVWLADNLAETKFRNGDYIHGYEGGSYQAISNAAWANLTDSALCAYNNDLNNV